MFKSGYAAIVGRPNVGKSLILNKLLGEKVAIVSKKPETTRDKIQGILTRENFQLVFIDTPGIHDPRLLLGKQMVKRAFESFQEADIILFIIDATKEINEQDKAILDLVKGAKKPAILVINKIDLVRKSKLLPVIDEASKLHEFKEIIPASAMTGDNMALLLDKAAGLLPEGPKFFPDDQLSDKDERFHVAELIRERVLDLTHEEVPHSVAVLIEEMKFRQAKDLYYIRAVIFVERQSQKGIMIGHAGAMLKVIGEESRKEIEDFLQKRAFLELWVKVYENWRQDERALRMLGYA